MPREERTQRLPIGIAGPAYEGPSSAINAQTLVNFYTEISNVRDKSEITLHTTPGTKFINEHSRGVARGSIVFKNNAYILFGQDLLKFDANEAVTKVGEINTTTGPVSMAVNGDFGDQLILVDGTDGWIYDGSTLTQITDVDFPSNPVMVVFMDSYFVLLDGSFKFYLSDLNDGSSWTATQFASAERDPDNITSVIVNERELWLLGEKTSEVWTNIGGPEFAFEPYPNGFSEYGIAARFSVAKIATAIIWLSQDSRGRGQIVMSDALRARPVSSLALEHEIASYDTISDAEAFTYYEEGHLFYQISFPSANKTWVYDTTIPDPNYAWHERRTNGGRHLARTHVFFNNKHYIGDYSSSNLLEMSRDYYTDRVGTETKRIYRERISPYLFRPSHNRIKYQKIELDAEFAVGLESGEGINPTVAVDWSDNGGKKWGNVRLLYLGMIGEFEQRPIIWHAGMSRKRLFRIRCSDPVKYVIINMYADVTEMNK